MDILIVDDDDLDRLLITNSLKNSHLKLSITIATTVDEGINHFRSKKFDLVLLDYRMPQRDGIEMLLEIKTESENSSCAIVMMSSTENEDLAIECLKAGAQDFLIKSDVSTIRLRRAILHAQARFELENQLITSYQKVKQLAESDSLTGLANRYLFDESLKLSIANNSRGQSKLALLMIDLDNFKMINDSYGHDVGDLLLIEVVHRIQQCLRGNELFARLGGDEFAISLSNLESPKSAGYIANRINHALDKPIIVDKREIQTTASIGIAIHPDNGLDSAELMKYSDIAMYRAKKKGRNQACFFQDAMQVQLMYRVQIERELMEAEDKKQFVLYYQPVINPNNESLVGFEALIRWEFDDTLRAPDTFIPIAEETKQIISIGRWVIENAIKTLGTWNKEQKSEYTMSINISAVQMYESELNSFIQQCLVEFNVAAHLIEIELTETALLGNSAKINNILHAFHNTGCKIALDDFGTGFSSISHLQKFPIDTVKIDKSIMPNAENAKNEPLIKGIVAMANFLGLSVVAEGVETQENANLCKSLDVSRIQGYFYAKPMSYAAIESKYFKRAKAKIKTN